MHPLSPTLLPQVGEGCKTVSSNMLNFLANQVAPLLDPQSTQRKIAINVQARLISLITDF